MRAAGLIFLMLASAAALTAGVSIQQYHTHDFSFPAQAAGNPFDAAVIGVFSGPDGLRLRVPGFYDGAGVWKIRFSPVREGSWTLRTESTLAALDGRTDEIACTPNRHPNIHGGLRVDRAHPYHFIYEDGTRYFLMGYEADWLWAVDMQDPKRPGMHRLIEQMAQRGFNHVILNVYAHDTTWSRGKQNQWDYGPPALFAWEGANEKPDHMRLNPAFFQLYDGMMDALRERGIVAHIMLKVYNKLVNWPAPGSAGEERWFRYVVARYQAYSNVVWDFSKESRYEKDDQLQARLLEVVRTTDAYRRLTTTHDDDRYTWDPALTRTLDFETDQQHTDWAARVAFDRALRRFPVLNAEFGYERGVDDLPTYNVKQDWQEQLRRAYLIYLAGGYGVYYYSNTAWDLVKPDPEPPGMRRFQLLKESLSALPWWRMEPANHLVVGGACLAAPGEAYAFYAEGPRITVNLTALDGVPAGAEWVDTWTGARENAAIGGPGVHIISKPKAFGAAPGLLLIRR